MNLKELLPPDLSLNGLGNTEWDIPRWAFTPDQWSWAFLRGLRQLQVRPGSKVWEVGVGTGLNVLFLSRWFPQSGILFSDCDHRCTDLALANLQAIRIPGSSTAALRGEWDLVSSTNGKIHGPEDIDILIACIPQVPKSSNLDLALGDNSAHYYDPSGYPESDLHPLGLGLNDALLERSRKVLARSGRIALNLAGRPGLKRLRDMFLTRGFTPRVLHSEVIPQDQETSLQELAETEKAGQPDFEFFADDAGTARLSARDAEIRRLQGLPVFHRIYVIEGTMS